jgi:hypothetical protein
LRTLRLSIGSERAATLLRALNPFVKHFQSLEHLILKNQIGYFELNHNADTIELMQPIESLPSLKTFLSTATISPDLSKPLETQLDLLEKSTALALNRPQNDLTWSLFRPHLSSLKHLTFLDLDLHFLEQGYGSYDQPRQQNAQFLNISAFRARNTIPRPNPQRNTLARTTPFARLPSLFFFPRAILP